MAHRERDAILVRRRRFLAAGLASLGASSLGCDKEPRVCLSQPQPCLSEPVVCLSPPQPCLSQPPEPVDAGRDAAADASTTAAADASTTAAADASTTAAASSVGDVPHGTWDPHVPRCVPRAPLTFVGDALDPPPPAPSALDPAVARRMGNLSDRFRASQPGYALTPENTAALDELAALLRGGPWFVVVEVELDPDPNFCGGIPLADSRAAVIRQQLVDRGVASDRSAAHGRSIPADSGICPVVDRFYQKVFVLVMQR